MIISVLATYTGDGWYLAEAFPESSLRNAWHRVRARSLRKAYAVMLEWADSMQYEVSNRAMLDYKIRGCVSETAAYNQRRRVP